MKARLLALAVCTLCLTGCSLVKLSEDIVQGTCQDDADCAELNDEGDPDFDPCQRWQCNTKQKLCRYGALDADGDEQTPASVMHGGERVRCERDAQQQDCDDTREQVGSGFPELCDERDNDCDGRADEAVLQTQTTRVVVFDGAGDGSAATDAAYARDAMSGAIAFGYGMLQGANSRPGASLLDAALMTSTDATPLLVENLSPALASQVALAPLDGDRFAYALVTTSGERRVLAGVWRTGANQIGVRSEIAQNGVSCDRDETCPVVLAPALASQDRSVLLSYLRYDAEPRDADCGQLGSDDAPATVVANLLERPTGSGGDDERLQELSTSALKLGESSDLGGPALLSVPVIGDVPASWLVAYADAAGDVVIDRVLRNGKTLVLAQAALIRIRDGGAHSAIALALGGADPEAPMLGIAYQRGCGSDARIAFSLRRLSDEGGLALETVLDSVAIGGASNEADPALVYSAARDVWLVAYRDRTGLRARAVSADGALHGTAPYTLVARVNPADGDEVDVLPLRSAVFDLGDDFAAVAHVLRASEDDPRAFEAVRLGCGLQ